jgi:hypothetical protein
VTVLVGLAVSLAAGLVGCQRSSPPVPDNLLCSLLARKASKRSASLVAFTAPDLAEQPKADSQSSRNDLEQPEQEEVRL